MTYTNISNFLKNLENGDLLIISKFIFERYQDLIKFECITNCPKENPISFIHENYNKFKGKNFKRIIAVGGGSIIDLAKILNSTSCVFDLKNNIIVKKYELWVLPTTYATGSETSAGAIYKDEFGFKSGLRGLELVPDKVFYDIELFRTLPANIQRESFFDLFSHVYETSLSKKATIANFENSLFVIKKLLEWNNENKLVIKKFSETMLKELSYCSFLSGINLRLSSTCAPHRIQYITSKYNNLNHSSGLFEIYHRWFPVSLKYIRVNLDNPFNIFINNKEEEISKMIFDLNICKPKVYSSELKFKILKNIDLERLKNDPTINDFSNFNEFLR
jgi:alcohol dehydrogenase YqhD (iron-dependent ADH family)